MTIMRRVGRGGAGFTLLGVLTFYSGIAFGFDAAALTSATDQLTNGSQASLVCQSETLNYDRSKGPYTLLEECDLVVRWMGPTEIGGIVYTPQKIVVQAHGSPDKSFEAPLFAKLSERRLLAGDWFSRERFKYGQKYEVIIYYSLKDAPSKDGKVAEKEESYPPVPIVAFAFVPSKPRLALQFTGKVFTAWQLSSAGDQSYIVPGLALGAAYRLANDFNDQDVIALRVMLAVGPNLLAKSTIVTDPMTMVSEVRNTQSVQILLGLEAVAARYISIGVAWALLGAERTGTPLMLFTYGELYPAASTK